MVDVLAFLICLSPVVGGVVALVALNRRQRARQAQRMQAVEELRRADGRAGHLAVVHHVYQRARTGAKAIIVWDATGMKQDAWFQGWSDVPVGAYLVLAGKVGYGPHNHNPSVYYVAPHQVLTVV